VKFCNVNYLKLLFGLFVLCALIFSGSVKGEEFTEEEFWWLAGEVDEKNITRAPSLEKEIERKNKVEIKILPHRKYFVSDEHITVKYKVSLPFNVSIDTESYRQNMAPFEVLAFNVGGRTAVPQIRDIDIQYVTVIVRLKEGLSYGTYTLPALKVPYEYESVSGSKRMVSKDVAVSEAVNFEKVPLYIDVLQTHDTGVIADAIPVVVEIHSDNSAEILNEYPQEKPEKGIVYLSGYKPGSPFVLLNTDRRESLSEHYRVIRWRYVVAVHDIDEHPFELGLPHVVWKKTPLGDVRERINLDTDSRVTAIIQRAASEMSENREGVVIADLDPVHIKVRSITAETDNFKSTKELHQEHRDERTVLLTLPMIAIWVISGTGTLWMFSSAVQFLRTRKRKIKQVVEEREEPVLVYDRWPWEKVLLKYRLTKAKEEFERNPTKERCGELRSLLTRCAVIRHQKERLVSVQEACAMTATELEKHVGRTPEIDDIRELERQLESGRYRKLSGEKRGVE
jgi:hypothetical protein